MEGSPKMLIHTQVVDEIDALLLQVRKEIKKFDRPHGKKVFPHPFLPDPNFVYARTGSDWLEVMEENTIILREVREKIMALEVVNVETTVEALELKAYLEKSFPNEMKNQTLKPEQVAIALIQKFKPKLKPLGDVQIKRKKNKVVRG